MIKRITFEYGEKQVVVYQRDYIIQFDFDEGSEKLSLKSSDDTLWQFAIQVVDHCDVPVYDVRVANVYQALRLMR